MKPMAEKPDSAGPVPSCQHVNPMSAVCPGGRGDWDSTSCPALLLTLPDEGAEATRAEQVTEPG